MTRKLLKLIISVRKYFRNVKFKLLKEILYTLDKSKRKSYIWLNFKDKSKEYMKGYSDACYYATKEIQVKQKNKIISETKQSLKNQGLLFENINEAWINTFRLKNKHNRYISQYNILKNYALSIGDYVDYNTENEENKINLMSFIGEFNPNSVEENHSALKFKIRSSTSEYLMHNEELYYFETGLSHSLINKFIVKTPNCLNLLDFYTYNFVTLLDSNKKIIATASSKYLFMYNENNRQVNRDTKKLFKDILLTRGIKHLHISNWDCWLD